MSGDQQLGGFFGRPFCLGPKVFGGMVAGAGVILAVEID